MRRDRCTPNEAGITLEVVRRFENAPLSSITDIYHLTGLSAPAPTATAWVTLSPTKLNSLFHVFDPTAENYVWPGTSTASAQCRAAGCGLPAGPGQFLTRTARPGKRYRLVQADWDTTFGRVPFRGNIGVRYASTKPRPGYSYDATAKAVVPTTPNSYHDWLPSINTVLEPADNFLIRLSARPGHVAARSDQPVAGGTPPPSRAPRHLSSPRATPT